MKTALQKLKDLWADRQYRQALKLAATWPRLGKHRDAIRGGWAAATNPVFYRQLGKDPDGMYTAGVLAVAERYGLPLPMFDPTVVHEPMKNYTQTYKPPKEGNNAK